MQLRFFWSPPPLLSPPLAAAAASRVKTQRRRRRQRKKRTKFRPPFSPQPGTWKKGGKEVVSAHNYIIYSLLDSRLSRPHGRIPRTECVPFLAKGTPPLSSFRTADCAAIRRWRRGRVRTPRTLGPQEQQRSAAFWADPKRILPPVPPPGDASFLRPAVGDRVEISGGEKETVKRRRSQLRLR